MSCKLLNGDRGQLEVQRQRLEEWEKANHKKSPDAKIIMICGNPTCIALEHMRVSASENWAKKKGQPPEVPAPESMVSNWRLVQIAKQPWITLTEEENESVARELIHLRKEKS